jgi:DNA-binding transcriptional MerR regulator
LDEIIDETADMMARPQPEATLTQRRKSRNGLYKISDLSRETGVSIGTIKFYMREGLLPAPTLKTGRNMAYYDRSFVDRIRVIKELRQKRFLPLEVIKAILERDREVISPHEIEVLLGLEGKFYEAIHVSPGHAPVKLAEVPERYGLSDEELRYCIDSGVLTPVLRSGEEVFEGDDILLLETFVAMGEAGFDRTLIPRELGVPLYVEALGSLAREELKVFSRAVTGKVDDAKLAEMAMAGVKIVEQFIVLLRRKLLLRAIQELREQTSKESTGTED